MKNIFPLLPYVPFNAQPPKLPVRNEDDQGGPDYVVRATVEKKNKKGLRLLGNTIKGQRVFITISIEMEGIVRVLLEHESDLNPQRKTLTRKLLDKTVDVKIHSNDSRILLLTGTLEIRVDLDPFRIAFIGNDGQVTLAQNFTETDVTGRQTILPFGFSMINEKIVAFHETFTTEPDEHFYGFGEKFTDFDKRGQIVGIWNWDAFGVHSECSYKNVPFYVSSRGYGVFVDSTTYINFDMGCSNNASSSFIVPDSALDYYVIFGSDIKNIITQYANLVSFPILPPKWSFGYWMSTGCMKFNADDVINIATLLRENEINSDVLHLDTYWQRDGCWSDLVWDRISFPDPEGMIKQIISMRFKICLWINPYLSIESECYFEAKEKDYLLKTFQGEVYVADVWGWQPPIAIIDFTNPEAAKWYKELLRSILKMGVDVFKTDFGEGIPVEVKAYNGLTGSHLHNLYPLIYTQLVSDVTSEETNHNGLVWGRSTYAGGQRHAAQWGGDPACTFQALASTLRGGLSIGMCGHAFWSHDIGGFNGKPTPELYVRWAQFGLLSPLARGHGTTTRLPWDFGEEALNIFRSYVRLRYKLLPYIYTYACIAAQTSLPIMRAMVMEFPNDPNTWTMDLQYMFGSEIMIAPIYNIEGRRHVYFPTGQWIDFWTNEVIGGSQSRPVECPLEVLPIYIKSNSLIPTIEPHEYIEDKAFSFVVFNSYLREKGGFELLDIDGVTQIFASINGSTLEIEVKGVKQELGFRQIPLLGNPAIEQVVVNGLQLNELEKLEFLPGADAGWIRDEEGFVRVMISNK